MNEVKKIFKLNNTTQQKKAQEVFIKRRNKKTCEVDDDKGAIVAKKYLNFKCNEKYPKFRKRSHSISFEKISSVLFLSFQYIHLTMQTSEKLPENE